MGEIVNGDGGAASLGPPPGFGPAATPLESFAVGNNGRWVDALPETVRRSAKTLFQRALLPSALGVLDCPSFLVSSGGGGIPILYLLPPDNPVSPCYESPVMMDSPPLSDLEIAVKTAKITFVLFLVGAGMIALLRRVKKRSRSSAGDGSPTTKATKVPLWLRMATLFVLTLLVLVSAWWSATAYSLVVALILILGLEEFHRMADALGSPPFPLHGRLGVVLIITGTIVAGPVGMLAGLAVAVAVFFSLLLAGPQNLRLVQRMAVNLTGVLHVGMLGSFLILIRHLPQGFGWTLFLLFVVQLADTFALLGGLAWGRRKLAPVLSPGKTWEGAVSGVFGAALGGVLFSFAVAGLHDGWMVFMAALLALAALGGDLATSALKRAAGIKDFGGILPGHGGILDRFDSYLIAAPAAWLMILIFLDY